MEWDAPACNDWPGAIEEAIREAEKLALEGNQLYHSLLANLYAGIDKVKSLEHLKAAYSCTRNSTEKKIIGDQINRLSP